MQRRDFIRLIAGSAVGWPLAARAQQAGIKRIGVLIPVAAEDQLFQAREVAFFQDYNRWVGLTAVMHASTFANGPRVRLMRFADMRRNWLRSPRTSSSLLAARRWVRCCA